MKKNMKFNPCYPQIATTDSHQNLRGWLHWRPVPLCKISSLFDYIFRPPLPTVCIKWLGKFLWVLATPHTVQLSVRHWFLRAVL